MYPRNKTSAPAKKKSNRKRIFLSLFLICLAIGIIALYKVFGPNTGEFKKEAYLYIPTGATYSTVLDSMEQNGFIKDKWSFNLLAKQADYPQMVKAGRYKIERGMSNYDMIRMLRSGRQEPVKLVINKLRTKNDFANFVAARLEPEARDIQAILSDSKYLYQYGLDTHTAMCAIIPDTYEFFWNTDAENVFEKIYKNYDRFWTPERKQQAAAMGLSPKDVCILASIVDEETNKNDEKPTIASVYLNRLNKGMLLQADPTVKFAVGDFTIKRILNKHTSVISPYNTYVTTGLPPGPICTPSKKSREAVLNPKETNYLYFCARADFSGYHAFAATYEEHLQNARQYQRALNERGIK